MYSLRGKHRQPQSQPITPEPFPSLSICSWKYLGATRSKSLTPPLKGPHWRKELSHYELKCASTRPTPRASALPSGLRDLAVPSAPGQPHGGPPPAALAPLATSPPLTHNPCCLAPSDPHLPKDTCPQTCARMDRTQAGATSALAWERTQSPHIGKHRLQPGSGHVLGPGIPG